MRLNLKLEKFTISPLLFWLLVFFSLFFLGFALKEFKAYQSKISTKLSEYHYLKYILTHKAPFLKKKALSAEDLETDLQKKGFSPELVKRAGQNKVELRFTLSFKELSRLFSFFQKKQIKVKSFKASSLSEEGNFKVEMIVE